MKKAIVVDWLDKYGGAERVIKNLNQAIVFDEVYTLINIMKDDEFKQIFPQENIITHDTFLRKFGSKFRYLYVLFFY